MPHPVQPNTLCGEADRLGDVGVPRRWGQGLGNAWEWGQARCLGASCCGLVTEAGREPRAAEAGVGDAVGGAQGLDARVAALTQM